MFKYTISKLEKTVGIGLRQNQIFSNVDQPYFNQTMGSQDYDWSNEDDDLAKNVRIVAKFKDFSGRRRPVSCLSWQKSSTNFAVSHCSPDCLGCHGEVEKDLYINDLHHTVAPLQTLHSPGHVTVQQFNDKQCSMLATGKRYQT